MTTKQAIVFAECLKNNWTINFDDLEDFCDTAIRSLKENKALRLLLDWAIECDFGYDFIPEEYEKYKDDIQDMSYADGLIYIAMKEVEDEHTD